MGLWSSLKEKAKSVGRRLKENWQEVKEAGRKIIVAVSERVEIWTDKAKRAFEEKIKEYKIRSKYPGYVPTEPDQKIAAESKKFLDQEFRRGIRETMRNQIPEERIQTIKDVVKKASQILDVDVDKVDFYQLSSEMGKICGYFDRQENSLYLNAYMITCDRVDLVEEQVYTVFHELIHARQWAAVTGKKDYGYASETILEWAKNFADYVPFTVSDEMYRRQPLERDAFGFEALIKGEYTVEDFGKYNGK